jgi:hypothetical protein
MCITDKQTDIPSSDMVLPCSEWLDVQVLISKSVSLPVLLAEYTY